jgi:hypothetical protein
VYRSLSRDTDDWVVGVERRGNDVRLVLERPFSYGVPITVAGAIDPSGAFEAKDAAGSEQLTLKGSIGGGGKLVAGFVGGTEKMSLHRAAPILPPSGTFDATYEGLVGDERRIRVRWAQAHLEVTASYQYLGAPTRHLRGTVAKETGAFALTETDDKGIVTGQWQGALFGESVVMGRWTSADRTKSLPFTLDSASGPYPEPVTLPSGGRLAPSERYQRRGSTCVDSTVFPQMTGIEPAAEASLNGELAKAFGVATFKAPSCVPSPTAVVMWNDTTYGVTGSGDGWIGIEERTYGYLGGAHGIGSSTCFVVTNAGKLQSLAQELPATARKRLVPIARAALLKQARATRPDLRIRTLQDVGFVDETPTIGADRSMCAVRDHEALFLEVVFQDERDGMFRVFDPRARISAEAVEPLFPAGSVGASVFGN